MNNGKRYGGICYDTLDLGTMDYDAFLSEMGDAYLIEYYLEDCSFVGYMYILKDPVKGITPDTHAGSLQDYDFNAKGQRTRSLVATQSASLTWTGERLASLETTNTHANYTYDASGMRIKTHLTSQGTEQTLRYVYDELRLCEVASLGDKEFLIGYLYEADSQTPVSASYETSDTATAFSLESNVRGDVVALRDTDGEVFARYIYSEYGVLKNLRTNATALIDEPLADKIAHNQPLRYAGYVYDDYSQMYYCSARYYDPATQVFVSIDPARADAERSGYLYCGGDPVNSTDPSGLWWSMRYHKFSKKDAAKYTAEKLAQMAITNIAEEIATTLIFAPVGGTLTVKAIRCLMNGYGYLSNICDGVRLVRKHARKGDKLYFQRSSYLYYKSSCHRRAQWELRNRMLLKRKNGALQDFKTLPVIPWNVRGVYSTRPLLIPHRRAARAF